MSIVNRARPEIQALSAYQAAEQIDDTVRLNANESPESNAIGNYRRPLNRYPEVRPQHLQEMLAAYFGCRGEQLLVTRGSSEAIDLVVRCFCTAGVNNIVTPSPSFSMYGHYAKVQGAEIIEVAMQAEQDFRIDIEAILDACNDATRVVFICSPNNPTGSPVPRDDLVRLIEGLAGQAAVVVDEAYIEFGDENSVIELLDKHSNMLVLRTLSKALGFAGARCGAVAGPADVIELLNAVQAPYALATPVVECVEDVLESAQLVQAGNAIAAVVSERERITPLIATYEFVTKVWPSAANFFLIRVTNAEMVMACCERHKVLLRHFGGDLADCIRITVGSREDNDRLLAAFDACGKS